MNNRLLQSNDDSSRFATLPDFEPTPNAIRIDLSHSFVVRDRALSDLSLPENRVGERSEIVRRVRHAFHRAAVFPAPSPLPIEGETNDRGGRALLVERNRLKSALMQLTEGAA